MQMQVGEHKVKFPPDQSYEGFLEACLKKLEEKVSPIGSSCSGDLLATTWPPLLATSKLHTYGLPGFHFPVT